MSATIPTSTSRTDDTRAGASTVAVAGRGAAAGLLAGAIFLGVSMWFTDSIGMPGEMPLKMMAAMLQGESALADASASVPLGLAIHAVLSAGFGVAFGLLARALRWSPLAVAAAGVLFGAALYVVNSQFIARLGFPWFLDANQPFELVVHVVFGSLVALAFLPARSRR